MTTSCPQIWHGSLLKVRQVEEIHEIGGETLCVVSVLISTKRTNLARWNVKRPITCDRLIAPDSSMWTILVPVDPTAFCVGSRQTHQQYTWWGKRVANTQEWFCDLQGVASFYVGRHAHIAKYDRIPSRGAILR